MFYYLLEPLKGSIALFSYITFRAFMAALTALIIAFIFYPKFINYLKRKGIGEAAKEDAPKGHLLKAGTPTMGGVMIAITVVIPVLLWAKLSNPYIIVALIFFTSFATIGFFDDLIKLRFKKRRDLYLKTKKDNFIKEHEDTKDSVILSSDNNNKLMNNFLDLIFEFIGQKTEIKELPEDAVAQIKSGVHSYLKDDIYQLYFKRERKEFLEKIKEIWKKENKNYEKWDQFLVTKKVQKESLKQFQMDLVDYFDINFESKFQEKRKLEEITDEWFKWISMPYAFQEVERQKKKWASEFLKEEKAKTNLVKDYDGLKGSFRFILEFLISGILLFYLFTNTNYSTVLQIPFFKNLDLNLGALYIFFGMIVVVAYANAVNLTDGLDGLAIGPVMISMVAVSLFIYFAGHSEFAKYLGIVYTKDIGELTIFSIAIVGAGMGFLWFNTYPAQIFMGDVGSLGLGASFGSLVVMSKIEFLSIIIGGIFVMEAISVILQVSVYKVKKVRIFRMAPLHHHFEKLGLHENKIIVRFWLIGAILAILALATLKIR